MTRPQETCPPPLLPMRRKQTANRRWMHPDEPHCIRLGPPPREHHLDDGRLLLRHELRPAPPIRPRTRAATSPACR